MKSLSSRVLFGAATSIFAVLAALPAVAADVVEAAPEEVVVVQEPTGGIYFVTRTGIAFVDDTSFELGDGAVTVENDYETGRFGFVGLGYSFTPFAGGAVTPRVEAEGFYGEASIDQHIVNDAEFDSEDSFGELKAYGAFASAYLDFNLGAVSGDSSGFVAALTPFIGAGIGAAQVELSKQGVSPTGVVMNDEDSGLAYHVSAGVGVDFGTLGFGGQLFEKSTLEIGYRYMEAPELEFEARDGTTSETDFTANMITVGFRKQF